MSEASAEHGGGSPSGSATPKSTSQHDAGTRESVILVEAMSTVLGIQLDGEKLVPVGKFMYRKLPMALQIHLQNYDERLMEVLEDYGELHRLVKAKHAKLLPLTADCPQQVRVALQRAGRRAPAAARAATARAPPSPLPARPPPRTPR